MWNDFQAKVGLFVHVEFFIFFRRQFLEIFYGVRLKYTKRIMQKNNKNIFVMLKECRIQGIGGKRGK